MNTVISVGDEGVPEPGAVVGGKFRIEERLGAGGLGVVVAATHLQLQQRVAIKFLLPCAMASADAVQRFLREAQAAAAIESPHCVRVMDFGTLDIGMPYIVMECLRGADLRTHVRDHGPMSPELAAECVLQACDAVAEAHSRGIIHRDLKPANLFLCERGDGTTFVKVLDFGIAKVISDDASKDAALTEEDVVLGTSYYMAPEQVRDGTKVDGRTDVWALGLILHELVAGAQAFSGRTTRAAVASIVLDAPPPLRSIVPTAPEELESIILRCLQKDPLQRFVSVRALMTALKPLAEGRVSSSRSAVWAPVIGAGALLALGAVSVVGFQLRSSKAPAALAASSPRPLEPASSASELSAATAASGALAAVPATPVAARTAAPSSRASVAQAAPRAPSPSLSVVPAEPKKAPKKSTVDDPILQNRN